MDCTIVNLNVLVIAGTQLKASCYGLTSSGCGCKGSIQAFLVIGLTLMLLFSCVHSYDLLCEDDPDDFVTLEIPTDSMTTDSDAPPPELDSRRKGGFLESIRRSRNMSGITVITGNRRMRGISGGVGVAKGGAGNPLEGTKAPLPLHDLGDEPRVLQGAEVGVASRHPEAANLVGTLDTVPGRDQREERRQSPEVRG